ncbi:MAG: Asp-tRNA(Asn)/Glu-tRNA(Gln) amidotransferase subunit GatB [Gemmatimonadetes bacterium]|nr:Asp-tRNA(Asn)/Glu-tRNA(Gln) amidotransferase subunit GatB [Gemmatimonadota bacterium]
MSYQPVIGLEVHVQLKTATKMFCGNSAEFGAEPNSHVCPVCLGLPGALPVINAAAVELGVRAALGLNCTIHQTSIFARKNYFYPDLPKGYQITQYDRPLATAGWLEVETRGTTDPGSGSGSGSGSGQRDAGTQGRSPPPGRRIRIRRIHLEEDAGKSLHDRFAGKTAVDLNRAGVPLIEIVTEPDLASPEEARAFLGRLKQVLEYLEVSDCDMEKGSLRVDANVSVRPAGSVTFGTKTEVKNMNSFANVERALAYEIERQVALLESGGTVEHETLLWDAARGEARPMRSKEESHDYRYFPDPDLPPLVLERSRIEALGAALPELPGARARRFREQYGLPDYDAEVLTATRAVADYYEALAGAAADPKAASNWVMTEVLAWLNQRQCAITELPITPDRLAQLIALVADGTLSTTMARHVFARMAETGLPPALIVQQEGLAQVRDQAQLEGWADEVLAAFPAEAERYRAGEAKLLAFLMGQLMRRSGGKADPRQASEILRRKLE